MHPQALHHFILFPSTKRTIVEMFIPHIKTRCLLLMTMLAFIHPLVSSMKGCQHDKLMQDYRASWVNTVQNYEPSIHKRAMNDSSAADDGFRPIRIHVDYSNIINDTNLESYIRESLVPATASWISSALAVIPVQGNLVLQHQCIRFFTNPFRCIEYAPPTCGSLVTIPDAHFDEGVPNADVIIYVTNQPTQGDAIAHGGACQFDQNQRPIAGNVNFNPINFGAAANNTEAFRYQVNAAIHEMFHALGFSSSLFPSWRDAQGRPYSQVTQTFTERGTSVIKLVTPKALARARDFFACSTLNGVELENQGGTGTAGSHWEKRLLNQEFMTGMGVYGDYTAKTAITLAAMEDSGWYRANYSAAETLYWGANAGCAFTSEPCFNGSGPSTAYPDYFCTDNSRLYCSQARLARATCNLAAYTTALPSEFQYFSDPSKGGSVSLMDFCPYYLPFQIAGTNRTSLCTDPLNQPPVNYWGESYGPGSRCFLSTIVDSSYTSFLVNDGSTCHDHRCTDSALQVRIGGRWISCPVGGGNISVAGFRGSFTCPPYPEMCSA